MAAKAGLVEPGESTTGLLSGVAGEGVGEAVWGLPDVGDAPKPVTADTVGVGSGDAMGGRGDAGVMAGVGARSGPNRGWAAGTGLGASALPHDLLC